VLWCSTLSPEKTAELLKPTEKWGKALLSGVGPMPFPVLQSLFDGLYAPVLQWYWKADFVDTLSDKAIAEHVKHGLQLPSMHSTMHLYPINGAVHRVGEKDTAWGFRKTKWGEVIVGVDPDPANKDKVTKWAKEYWEAVHPFSAGGAYINMMMEEGEARVEASYSENFKRLGQIKAKYDPGNLFRVNQNIAPKA
jgi:hypothetical protein